MSGGEDTETFSGKEHSWRRHRDGKASAAGCGPEGTPAEASGKEDINTGPAGLGTRKKLSWLWPKGGCARQSAGQRPGPGNRGQRNRQGEGAEMRTPRKETGRGKKTAFNVGLAIA